jgi:hypothetical protein
MGFFKNKKMFWKQHVNLDCKCKFEWKDCHSTWIC